MTASRNKVVDLRKKHPGSHISRASQSELPFSAPVVRRKRTSLRSRRIKFRLWLSALVLCCISLLVIAVSYVSYLPRYNIRSIAVQGAVHVPVPAILAYVDSSLHPPGQQFLSPSNIFLYHPGALATAISARFPWIKEVRVGRGSLFSTHLLITVQERRPFALWCQSPDATSTPCYEMDKSGFIFAPVDPEASTTRATSYVFTGGLPTQAALASTIGDTFAPQQFGSVLNLMQYLSLDGFSPLGANVVSDTDYTVPLASGFYLKASFGQDPQMLVKNLQLVLGSDPLKSAQDKLQYVDLRFGDRVYYKFNGATGTASSS